MFKESKGPKVAAAGIEIRTGRKWCANHELRLAEEKLRHKRILGSVAKGHAGLGYLKSPRIETRGERHAVQGEVRAGV